MTQDENPSSAASAGPRAPAPSDSATLPPADGRIGKDAIEPSRDIAMLLAVMQALRDPEDGCPWDQQQTFASIAPYTIEEAHEVADAIERGDFEDLADELGDLLLQVVYHAQMASEIGRFAFGDVVYAVTRKMIRRHPHVFGDDSGLSVDKVRRRWEDIKAEERAEKAARRGIDPDSAAGPQSLLSGIPRTLPALSYALKLQGKAAKVGFDWNDPSAVLDKISEEAREIVEAVEARDRAPNESASRAAVEEEIGDLLFTAVNLARHLSVDPETALRGANAKFERRFAHIEAELRQQGKALGDASLLEMEALWQAAKTDNPTLRKAARTLDPIDKLPE